MEELERLKEERRKLQEKVKEIWKSGHSWTQEDHEIRETLTQIHSEVLELELKNSATAKERVGYSVCGWSDKHGYFRNKSFTSEKLEEAKAELDLLKTDPSWGIPTLIVKETKLRSASPAMADDFDTSDFEHLGAADYQELVTKHMCGNKTYRWKYLLTGDNFTY